MQDEEELRDTAVGERRDEAVALRPLDAQPEKATGIEPASCSADPSRRPETVKAARRETPCMARRPVTLTVMVAPEVNAVPSAGGRYQGPSPWLAVCIEVK